MISASLSGIGLAFRGNIVPSIMCDLLFIFKQTVTRYAYSECGIGTRSIGSQAACYGSEVLNSNILTNKIDTIICITQINVLKYFSPSNAYFSYFRTDLISLTQMTY